MDMISLKSLDIRDKRVLIRVDFNVPIMAGKITSKQRIEATLPTIDHCLEQGAKILLMSHLGRPKTGQYDEAFSLEPVAKYLQQRYNMPVQLVKNWQCRENFDQSVGTIALLENVRFIEGETANDDLLGQKLARFCDIFVMDAFGCAHRAHSSTHAVAKHSPIACGGPLLMAELQALSQALSMPKRPLIALVGGAKVSTKLELLLSLSDKVDALIVGGGIANTFALANGQEIGRSLCEANLVQVAQTVNEKMQVRGAEIPVIEDVVVAKTLKQDVRAINKKIDTMTADECIFDLGDKTVDKLCTLIEKAGTIVWNGPIGVFEFAQFARGTERISKAIARSGAFSIAGGGDTLAAIEQFGIKEDISYISTGGGAFLQFLEGKTLPAVDILQQRHLTT